MRIAILDDYQGAFPALEAARRLGDHEVVVFRDSVRGAALVERLHGCEAAILLQQRTALPREVVEGLDTLRMIAQTGRHTAHLDLRALAERGITVSAVGSGTPAVTAELTWGLILAALRGLPDEVARLRAGSWQGSVGTRLIGTTLGVLGLGGIGGRVAAVGAAFGMQVLVGGRAGSAERAAAAGYAVARDTADLFARSDVLTVHLPLNASTAGIVTAADLARMKPDALFVNTSRAGLVAPGVLAAALAAGRPGRAAIDVFDDEPVLGAADPLIALPQVTATPHLGYVEWGVLETLYGSAADAILAYAAGEPTGVVGPPDEPVRSDGSPAGR